MVDCSIFPDIYRPADHWRALLDDVPSDPVHLPSGDPVPDLSSYSHIILTGSETSITTDESWFEAERELILNAFRKSKSILGSCFGHQMLAYAISGREYVAASPTPEVGWTRIDVIENDALFEGLKNPFFSFVSHFDEVSEPPLPWKVLARSKQCAVQAMRYGDRPIWGIQAHPEINPEDGRILLEGFIRKIPEKAHLIHPVLAQTPLDDNIAAGLVYRFLNS